MSNVLRCGVAARGLQPILGRHGVTDIADAVFSALIHARMRVLPENDAWVRLLLGERAELCPSLKKRKR